MQTLVDNMVGLATAHGIQDVWITEMKVQNSATEVSIHHCIRRDG